MKLIPWLSAAIALAGLLAGSAGTASAQSDKTLGINCTQAGHAHCGETGRLGGGRYWHHRHHHRYYRY